MHRQQYHYYFKRRKTSVVLMFKAFNLEGVIISYCFKYPPQVFISTTPFIPDNWRFTTQS
jgi:hypothetical protein